MGDTDAVLARLCQLQGDQAFWYCGEDLSLGFRFEFAQARHDALPVLGHARGPPKQKSMPVAKRPPAGWAAYM